MNTTTPNDTTPPNPTRSTTRRARRCYLALTLACIAPSAFAPAALAGVRWSAPSDLSRAESEIGNPIVASDRHGDTVAVWRSSGGIFAAWRPAGKAWQTPVALAKGRGAQQPFNPTVAIDPHGDALAAWERSPNVNAEVFAALRPAGHDWRAPVRLTRNGNGSSGPRAAMDRRGDAFMLWEGSVEVEGIWGDFMPNGKGWGKPEELSTPGEGFGTTLPQLAVSPDGAALAAWSLQSISAENITESARSTYRAPGGLWQTPVTLANDLPGGTSATSVALDEKGGALVLWEGFEHTSLVQSALRPGGASPGPTETAFAANASIETDPRVGTDSRGDAIAVAVGSHHGHPTLYALSRPATGGWHVAGALYTASGAYGPEPQLAVDSRGDAVVAWVAYRGSGTTAAVESAVKPFDGGWSAPATLATIGVLRRPGEHDTIETDVPAPQVSIDPAGEAVVAWFDFTSGRDVVQSARALATAHAGHGRR